MKSLITIIIMVLLLTTSTTALAKESSRHISGMTKNGKIVWEFYGLAFPIADYDSLSIVTDDDKQVTWSDGVAYDFTSDHACGDTVFGTGYATYKGVKYKVGSGYVENTPCPPTGLKAEVSFIDGLPQADLTWNATTGAQNYQVYRALDDSEYVYIAHVKSTSFTDTSLFPNRNYKYAVVALTTRVSELSAPVEVNAKQ